MAQDERLREALLELQALREREARTLGETRALLRCLEAYSAAPGPAEALASIFVSLSGTVGADLSLLVEAGADGAIRVAASDGAALPGAALGPPFDPFSRPRNLSDLDAAGPWTGALDLSDYRGLLVAPVAEAAALL
ncbi:MAG: hypothetical protein AAF968_21760, partial [Pseudomonadota bacterium]